MSGEAEQTKEKAGTLTQNPCMDSVLEGLGKENGARMEIFKTASLKLLRLRDRAEN